jgi:hypothetical protein
MIEHTVLLLILARTQRESDFDQSPDHPMFPRYQTDSTGHDQNPGPSDRNRYRNSKKAVDAADHRCERSRLGAYIQIYLLRLFGRPQIGFVGFIARKDLVGFFIAHRRGDD